MHGVSRYTCTASNGYSDAEDSVDISVEQIQVGAVPHQIIAIEHIAPFHTVAHHPGGGEVPGQSLLRQLQAHCEGQVLI